MKPKPVDRAKVRQAVVLAKQISELRQQLKLLEKGMTVQEFVAYVEGTRVIPSHPLPKQRSAGIDPWLDAEKFW